jgi:hypothetical protein
VQLGRVVYAFVPALMQVGSVLVDLADAMPGSVDEFLGGGGVAELADRLVGQAEYLADLGVVLALGYERVDGGVTFPGPDRGQRLELDRYRVWSLDERLVFRFGFGFAQVSAVSANGVLDRDAQVVPQMQRSAIWVASGAPSLAPSA